MNATAGLPGAVKCRNDLFLSCGFDASYVDPLGRMMLSARDFHDMTTNIIRKAEQLCNGRVVLAHEGGYSMDYVPYCGLYTVAAMMGLSYGDLQKEYNVSDPFESEVNALGCTGILDHQKQIVNEAAKLHFAPHLLSPNSLSSSPEYGNNGIKRSRGQKDKKGN